MKAKQQANFLKAQENLFPMNQIAGIRERIEATRRELRDLDSAVLPVDESMGLVEQMIASSAAEFERRAGYSRFCSAHTPSSSDYDFFSYTDPGRPFELMCLLFGDAIKAHIKTNIEAVHADRIAAGLPEVSRADLPQKIESAKRRLFELECQEEILIEAMEEAHAQNPSAPPAPDRRPDANPIAVLYKGARS